MNKCGYTYIITNKSNTTLYIGVTSDLAKRIWQHKNKVVDGFSKRYNLNKLVYYENCETIEAAIVREKYLKGKTRQFKEGNAQKIDIQQRKNKRRTTKNKRREKIQ